jgi:hypothetical protein
MTTITQEQFEAGLKALPPIGDTRDCIKAVFAAAGITIAPPEPSEEMVKLAREIAETTAPGWLAIHSAGTDIALATLQHVERVVRDARTQRAVGGEGWDVLGFVLNQIGSNRHD